VAAAPRQPATTVPRSGPSSGPSGGLSSSPSSSPATACTSARVESGSQYVHTARARAGQRAWFEVSANLSCRLRTVADRPQTGLSIGPSAVGQRPRSIHEQPSPGPFGVNLAIIRGCRNARIPAIGARAGGLCDRRPAVSVRQKGSTEWSRKTLDVGPSPLAPCEATGCRALSPEVRRRQHQMRAGHDVDCWIPLISTRIPTGFPKLGRRAAHPRRPRASTSAPPSAPARPSSPLARPSQLQEVCRWQDKRGRFEWASAPPNRAVRASAGVSRAGADSAGARTPS